MYTKLFIYSLLFFALLEEQKGGGLFVLIYLLFLLKQLSRVSI